MLDSVSFGHYITFTTNVCAVGLLCCSVSVTVYTCGTPGNLYCTAMPQHSVRNQGEPHMNTVITVKATCKLALLVSARTDVMKPKP